MSFCSAPMTASMPFTTTPAEALISSCTICWVSFQSNARVRARATARARARVEESLYVCYRVTGRVRVRARLRFLHAFGQLPVDQLLPRLEESGLHISIGASRVRIPYQHRVRVAVEATTTIVATIVTIVATIVTIVATIVTIVATRSR